jgi:uncharacterized membrane protein YGL010W
MDAEARSIRRMEVLLAEYEQNHNNPTNKAIHCFAVPIIAWAILAILWYLPTPTLFDRTPYLNWATILCALAVIYYLTLSIPLALGMAIFAVIAGAIIRFSEANASIPLIYIAVPVFISGWVFLFVGHMIEDRSLSFLVDMKFVAIEPVWHMRALFRCLHIPH